MSWQSDIVWPYFSKLFFDCNWWNYLDFWSFDVHFFLRLFLLFLGRKGQVFIIGLDAIKLILGADELERLGPVVLISIVAHCHDLNKK